MSVKFIDPTKDNLTGNTNYDNLFIYVNMTAERRGGTVINEESDNNTIANLRQDKVNLLGYKINKIKNVKTFTTDYSDIYRNETNLDGIFEGFGIHNISIETNSSYVPMIKVEFVDIKGMSFFNKSGVSPYSILFDFPPPIFTLVVKGYYGQSLEYKLHLLRYNTRFEAETGNYYINAEFVGNTFAPLADILFQNVLMVSKLENETVNLDDKGIVNNLPTLLAKAKTIKNDLKELTNNNDNISDFNRIKNRLLGLDKTFNTKIELRNNVKLFEVNPFDSTKITGNVYNSIEFNKLKKGYNYFLFTKNITSTFSNKNIEDELNLLSRATTIKYNGTILNQKTIDGKFVDEADIQFNLVSYTHAEITNLINEYNNELNRLRNQLSDVSIKIENNINNVVKSELGFEPTIKNVMKIILDDTDKWINLLKSTYIDSNNILDNNFSNIINSLNIPNPDKIKKLYPFPDYIDNNYKGFPGNSQNVLINTLPEVKLVNDFIDVFVDAKKEERFGRGNTNEPIDDLGNKIWYPITPIDGTFYRPKISIYNKNYIPNIDLNNKIEKNLILKYISRYYIYRYFTFFGNDSNIDALNFFNNEHLNILNTVNDVNILRGLKSEIDTNVKNINNFKNLYFNNDAIKDIERITNIIISQLDTTPVIDNEGNYSGIRFSNKTITLKTAEDISIFTNIFNQVKIFFTTTLDFEETRNTDETGFTLNSDNTLTYYDGNNNDLTSYRLYNIKEKKINNILFQNYINLNLNNDINELKNEYDISDKYKKYYGYLHVIYIPSFNTINNNLFNIPNITQLPNIIKLIIGSYVYAINNEVITDDFDYIKGKLNYIKTNIPLNNERNIFISKLKNLSEIDKNQFIEFYESIIDLYEKELNEFFDKLFLINNPNIKNNEIEKILNDNSNINEIFNILKEKKSIINSSNYTFADKSNSIVDEFTFEKIRENLISNNAVIVSLKDSLLKLSGSIEKKSEELNKTQEDFNKTVQNKTNELRIETYYSFKNFIDRWFSLDETTDSNISITSFNNNGNLIDLFTFVDRTYNSREAENAIVDITILTEFENNYNVNMLTVIGKLLNENGFEFFPLQNFMVFNTENNDNWNSENIFTPSTIQPIISAPRFTCMYIGGTSSFLNSDNNKNTNLTDDGFTDIDLPEDFTKPRNINDPNANGFKVKFGDGKQSIFISIELNTEEHQPTNESLQAMSEILDGELTPVPISQNLFSVYEQRSYTCKIKMFGNAMIQPTQFFQLENVPMFSGVYLILKVSHTIDGETNSMFTEFEGVRLPKYTKPIVTNPMIIYGNTFANLDLFVDNRQISLDDSALNNISKEDRKVYLVAGHNQSGDGNQGATAFFNNELIIENQLTVDFRDILKRILDNKNINNEIDDNTKTLNQTIADLSGKVKENDILIDIHFNSNSTDNNNPVGEGTEVFISENNNDFTKNLAKEIVNTINKVLGIKKRTNINNGLPSGVKLQSESYVETSAKGRLGIFNLKTNVILIEFCFINNSRELAIYNTKKIELAEAIANILGKISKTTTDISLSTLNTFSVLNTLRYNNINNRFDPYLFPNKLTIKNILNNILPTKYYEYIDSDSKISGKTSLQLQPFVAEKLININKNEYIEKILDQIEFTSKKYGFDSIFLAGIIYIESKFRPSAVSSTGALGISQFVTSSGLLQTLGLLQTGKINKTKVYKHNGNSYIIDDTITYEAILKILFTDNNILDKYNFNSIGSKEIIRELNGQINTTTNLTYYDTMIKNIWNNPFIMVELAGIYLKWLEKNARTAKNKNLGILSISYNIGTVTSSYNEDSDKPYFDNLLKKYQSNNINIIDIRKKITRKVKNEGIEYPERLIQEFIIQSGVVDASIIKNREVVSIV